MRAAAVRAHVFRLVLTTATAALLSNASPARAAFHAAVIDEVLTSYNGDPTAQFVEIRMIAGGQMFIEDSVLGAFDAAGAYLGDVLVVPSNVSNGTNNARWIMATASLQAAAGITADFTIPASLPVSGGMVCWGALSAGTPPNPASWNHAVATNYTECIAYGTYAGPTNSKIGTPEPISPVDRSLQRVAVLTPRNNAAEFACSTTITPTNNAGSSASLPATASCNVCGDGSVSGVEECDDGNAQNGDCCSSTCLFEVGSCDDANPCTNGDTCSSGVCTGNEIPPLGGCFTPTLPLKSVLKLKNHATTATKDALTWTWTKGAAFTLAPGDDPVMGGTDYFVCLYDSSGPGSSPKLQLAATMPAGGLCGTRPKPCWKTTKTGYTYTDSQLTPDGVKTFGIKQNAVPGKSSFKVGGKGVLLDMPTLPFTPPVIAQLANENGTCWQATFSAPAVVKKPAEDFKAKSD